MDKAHCISCKGRYCDNYARCPLYSHAAALLRSAPKEMPKEFSGQAPAPFIGRFGYPHVNVGILSPTAKVEDAQRYDDPLGWSAKDAKIPEIVGYRSALINARAKAPIKSSGKTVALAQEVGMASRPLDVDVQLKEAPLFRMRFSPEAAPHGAAAEVKTAKATSNPHVPTAVEKAVEDTDWKASDALAYLHGKGFDEHYLSQLLSVGTLGVGASRKLVPTRWSITATDDMLGKTQIEELKRYPLLGYRSYFGGYLGNYYLLLFFSEPWRYELFEAYALRGQVSSYSTDFEPNEGRKDYAEATAGGYYTVRLAIAEHLAKIRRQGSCLAIRIITDEYAVPLGVWVTREAARKALSGKPIEFSSAELMIAYAIAKAKKSFGTDISSMIQQSVLLKERKEQSSLRKFL